MKWVYWLHLLAWSAVTTGADLDTPGIYDEESGSGSIPGSQGDQLEISGLTNLSIFLMDLSSLKKLPVVSIANVTDRALGGMDWSAMEKGTRLWAASTLLHTVAQTLMASPTASAGAPLSISTHNLDVEIRSHRGNAMADERLDLNVSGNEMELYWSAITTDNHTGPTTVGFINYRNLGSALEGAGAGEGAGPEPADFRLISSVVTVAVGQGLGSSLREPLNLTLRHSEGVGSGIVQCVSLDEEGLGWSRRGCEVVAAGRDRTTCRCQYLASFAILASPAPVQDHVALHIITVVGVSVSLVGLAVAIATFALCRSLPRETRAMHANLCLSLFLAQLLFVTGISSTRHQVVCALIAASLHYLFLAAFAWMFLEGLQLFLVTRQLGKLKVPGAGTLGIGRLYLLGYLPPALVVGITAAVNHRGYGSSRHCWLQLERGFIWSFLGPVCFMILVNLYLFTATLWALWKQLATLNADVSMIKNRRGVVLRAVARVFVLGITWILGLFQVGDGSLVMTYLFTIVNSFQGTFIFIILCLLSKQVRREYCSCFSRQRILSTWVESHTTSTSPTSMEMSGLDSKTRA